MGNTKKKIILVEDDPALIDIYKIVMEKHHYELLAVASGKEALEVIKKVEQDPELKPAVFLLDLILPDMDGLDILKAVKTSPATKDCLVFILTNKERVGFEELGAGKPDEFFVKANITPTELVEVIKKHIG